ncbi:MAG: hypothetical protein OES57_05265 [Acidimicrobiia bacterium]|nr:hypothetical protein [Acidimicrobiia bacterium]
MSIPLDGPFYGDLAPGDELPRQPGVTIDSGMCAYHQAIVGERLPLSLDQRLSAEVTGDPRALVSPGLVMQLSIGLSTTVSRRAIANLFYRGVRIHQSVFVGQTLETVVKVIGCSDGTVRPDRPGRGKVLVDIVTTADGEPAVTYERCPMLPVGDNDMPGYDDDLGGGDTDLDLAALVDLPAAAWPLSRLGPPTPWAVGDTIEDPLRDIVDHATGLVRLTHNLAFVHRNVAHSPYPERLVYGGHVVGLAQASLSRVINGLAAVVAWHECAHTGPAFEGDLLSFRHTLVDELPVGDGRLLAVRVEGFAHRDGDEPASVLDWTPVVLAP